MRILLFFDLPTLTYTDRRDYRLFRKYLIQNGFVMIQESIYVRLMLNAEMAKIMYRNLVKNKPKSGLVQILMITENQYNKMIFLVGEKNSDVLMTTDRLVDL